MIPLRSRLKAIFSFALFIIVPVPCLAQYVPPRFDTTFNWKSFKASFYHSIDTLNPFFTMGDEIGVDSSGNKVLIILEALNRQVNTYNSKGLQISMDRRNYFYNSYDSLIEITGFGGTSKQPRVIHTLISYNPQRLRVRDLEFTNDTLTSETIYERDQAGRLDTIVEHCIEFGLTHRIAFTYDQHGQLSRKTSIAHNNKSNYVTEYEYDARGRKVSERTYYEPPLAIDTMHRHWFTNDTLYFHYFDSISRVNSSASDSARREEFNQLAESDMLNWTQPLPIQAEAKFRRKLMKLVKFDSAGYDTETIEFRDDSTMIRRERKTRFPNHVINMQSEESFDEHNTRVSAMDTITILLDDHGHSVREESYQNGKLDTIVKSDYTY